MEGLEFQEIESRTIRALEWDRLKNFVAAECTCDPAQQSIRTLALHDSVPSIERALDETYEAQALLESRSDLVAHGLTQMDSVLQRMSVRGTLSCHELLQIQTALTVAKHMRASLTLLPADSFPRLTAYIDRLPSAERLLRAIVESIDESGIVKDEASSLLRDLRREVTRLDGGIKETLQRLIHSSTVSKSLSEPLYTQRNGRYVLPVSASMRSQVSGIVHDSSASGLTVYVEPMAVIEISNKIRIKSAEIEREIARILEELSNLAASFVEEVSTGYETAVALDAITAKARLALKYRGTRPEISKQSYFDFRNCRHPLLVLQTSLDQVIANDISMGAEDARTLIITGPNTGGKTVLLKTIGIFSLMVRAGMLLPVAQGSTAPVFRHICADIGDEQSLEQSLSTFSSHMKNIVAIANGAGPGILVLLDEVGAGTDPREGAALARSILEYLNSSGAVTISTTHYGELKTLAYTQQGFINGSLDFDDATLSPTYRLRLGVPGSSKATTIAQRLGLNETIIGRAKELAETADADLQATIDQLEKRLLSASIAEEEAKKNLAEAEKIKSDAEEELSKLETESAATKRKLSQEFESEMKLGTDYIKHLIAELQRKPTIQKAQQAQQDLEKVRKELRWDEPQSQLEKEASSTPSIGQLVRVRSLNQRGTILAVPHDAEKDEAAPYTVQIGTLKIKTPIKDLEILQQQQQSQSGGKHGRKSSVSASEAAQRRGGAGERGNKSAKDQYHSRSLNEFIRTQNNTLDLRGQRIEAGMENVERFIDESLVTGTSPLMIIHGHGTGAMKSAVRDYLRQLGKTINEFRSGDSHEGGDGVTIVLLD